MRITSVIDFCCTREENQFVLKNGVILGDARLLIRLNIQLRRQFQQLDEILLPKLKICHAIAMLPNPQQVKIILIRYICRNIKFVLFFSCVRACGKGDVCEIKK